MNATADTIRLVIVDDHAVVRAGIRALLESQPDLCVVGEADASAGALAVVRSTEPDVVLMDLNLAHGDDGAHATAQLLATPHPPRVLVLTTYDTEADILAAIDAGASGYLLKDAPPAEVFDAIRRTARGETVLAPAVAAILFKRSSTPRPGLSEREVAILDRLAQGLPNKQIARQLMVSEATIKSHLSHIYTKLGVDTRAAAVARAMEQRIIRPTST